MTEGMHESLKELQEVDAEIDRARARIAGYEPELQAVDEPALALESEVEKARTRLQELRLHERRAELSVDEKRARLKMLQERLGAVRNLREEAAVRAETDLIRQALEADEQEAYSLIDQIRRIEESVKELESRMAAAREEVEPRRKELFRELEAARSELAVLEKKREGRVSAIATDGRRIYENLRSGGRSIAVASLTADGACGHCFSMIPLQIQAEVRRAARLFRCEACGVILAPPDGE